MAERQEALADVYDGRAEIQAAGLRPFRLFIIRRSWSGARPGLGEHVDSTTEIIPRPRVESSGMSAARWGGLYNPGDVTASDICPKHDDPSSPGDTRGYGPDDLVPVVASASIEVLYKIVHDDLPGEPTFYSLVSTDFTRIFGYDLLLRRRTETQGGYFSVRTPQVQP